MIRVRYICVCLYIQISSCLLITVRVDTTRPLGGSVHTGLGEGRDATYSSDITDVTVSWEGFADYESQINEYLIQVNHKPSDGTTFNVIHSDTVEGTINQVTWTHFSFANGDSVSVAVRAENGAGLRRTVSSSTYVIDLTPAHVNYLVDGGDPDDDITHQSLRDQLTVTWNIEDEESGIKRIEITVLEVTEGRRVLVYPDESSMQYEINSTLTTHTIRNLSLNHGMKYITVLFVTNGAGVMSEYESSGVLVDTTPPLVPSVSVDGEVAMNYETSGVEVVVPSRDRVSVRWLATDVESNIAEVLVGIVDENDTLVDPGTTSFGGLSSGGVVGNLNLAPGALYRVAVIAVNQAQLQSQITFSHPFRYIQWNSFNQNTLK